MMPTMCVVAAGAVVYQAAKLVCCQRYYRWRNDTLLKLVQWFDVDYPDQLDAAKLKEVTPLASFCPYTREWLFPYCR